MNFKILQSSDVPVFQQSKHPLFRIAGVLALLCIVGCTTSFPKPPLSVDAQAEAFSHFSIGLLAEATGDSIAALEHLESAIRLDPGAEKLYPPAIAVALKLEQPDEALRLARQLKIKHPNKPNSLLICARVYALTDQPAEAETLFKQTVSDFPENPENHLSLARFFFSQNQPSKTIRTLELALEKHTENLDILQLLGSLLVEQSRTISDPLSARQRVLEGLCFLEKALTIDGSDPKRWQQAGYIHLSIQHFEKALAAFENARSLVPEDIVLAQQVLELSIQSGAYDHALELSETLPIETGKDPDAWFQFLIEKTPAKHRERLIEHLEEKLQKKNPPIFYYTQLSSLYMQEEKYDKAYAAFNHVRTHSPDTEWMQNPFFAFNFMIAAQKSDHLEAALGNARQFERLAKNQGKTNLLDGFFYYQYATIHERIGQLETAEKYFLKAIDLGDETTASSAQNYIAYMWAERGEKLEFSLSLIEQALSAEPNNAAFIDTLGWIYYMQGRYEEALVQLKTASEIFQGDSTIWEHLGDTYLKLGDPTAAQNHWKKAQKLSPDSEHLNKRIKENAPNKTQVSD